MLVPELSKKEQLDETFLLQQIMQGDYKAFTVLYETYVQQLTNYAFKFTNDIQTIEDSIHDIFVWFWNHREHLAITYSIKAYLFKSVRTSIIRKLEHNKKVIFFDDDNRNEAFNYIISSEEHYVIKESRFLLSEKLSNVVHSLTSKQQEVIYLRFHQGLSFEEIANNMNLSTKACYKLMGRAISELRKSSVNWYAYTILFFLFFWQSVG